MQETQCTFTRLEKKYLISESQAAALLQELECYLAPDEYGAYSILSLYFDSPDLRALRAGWDKPDYREKLRLRSYGVPGGQDTVFLELKKKLNGIGFKRREMLSLADAYRFLQSGIRPAGSGQVLEEVDWAIREYDLRPVLVLSYDRLAFTGKQEPGLRITFDRNLRWRDQELRPDAGVWGERLLARGSVLMEIKTCGALPFWLARTLSRLAIYPTSFSKYTTAAERLLHKEETTRHVG